MVRFSTAEYNDENCGALVSLLEALGFNDAAERMWEAGVFIPVEIQIELQECIIELTQRRIELHNLERESFLAMFDSFPRLSDSLDVYIQEFFSWEDIRDGAVADLIDHHGETIGEIVTPRLQKLADILRSREILPYRNLFTLIFEELIATLVISGRISEEPRQSYRRPDDNKSSTTSFEQNAALEVLEFPAGSTPNEGQIKQRFKKLMKRYHPDLNPSGLTKAKEINRAYALLRQVGR